jgi:antitoxin PrlF
VTVNSFRGSITTSGKSEAIRLEKALFRLHPEFRQKAKVRADIIAPGRALITVVDEQASAEEEEDPVVLAYLAFLEKEIKRRPERIREIPADMLERAARLTEGVTVSDDEVLPDDVTM